MASAKTRSDGPATSRKGVGRQLSVVARRTLSLVCALALLVALQPPGWAEGLPDPLAISPSYEWYSADPAAEEFNLGSGADWLAFSRLVNGEASADDAGLPAEPVSFVGKTVKLSANISLAGVNAKPAGTAEHPFQGIFDGQSRSISNYALEVVSGKNIGLFGYAGQDSQINALNLSGEIISYDITDPVANIGSIVGKSEGSLSACTSNTAITISSAAEATSATPATVSNVGGIAGQVYGDMVGCSYQGQLNITTHQTPYVDPAAAGNFPIVENVGGVVGHFGGITPDEPGEHGTLGGCTNDGSVSVLTDAMGGADRFGERLSARSIYVGGVAGYSNGSLYSCTNSGRVYTSKKNESFSYIDTVYLVTRDNGGSAVGGVAGAVRAGSSSFGGTSVADAGNAEDILEVKLCSNLGIVTGLNDVGGVVGITGSYISVTECTNGNGELLYDNIAKGMVVSTRWNKPSTGGIVGKAYGTISYCYNRGEIQNVNIGYYEAGIVGMLMAPGGNKPLPELFSCYNAGRISPGKTWNYRYGGIAGLNDGYIHDCVVMEGTVLGAADSPIGDGNKKWIKDLKVLPYEELCSSKGTSVLNGACTLNSEDRWDIFWHVRGDVNDGYPVLNNAEEQLAAVDISTTPPAVVEVKPAAYNASQDPIPQVSLAYGADILYQNGDFYVCPEAGSAGQLNDEAVFQARIIGIGRYTGVNASLVHYSIGAGSLADATVVTAPTTFNWEVQFPKDVGVFDIAGNRIDPSQYSYLIYDNTATSLVHLESHNFPVFDSEGFLAFGDEGYGTLYPALSDQGKAYAGRDFKVYDRDSRLISDSEGWVYEALTGRRATPTSGTGEKRSDIYYYSGTSSFGQPPTHEGSADSSVNVRQGGHFMQIVGRDSYQGSFTTGWFDITPADIHQDCDVDKITYNDEQWLWDSAANTPYKTGGDGERVLGMSIPFTGATIKPEAYLTWMGEDIGYLCAYVYGKLNPASPIVESYDKQPNRNVTKDTDNEDTGYAAALTVKSFMGNPKTLEIGRSGVASGAFCFKNYLVISFDITPGDFSECEVVATDQVYTGNPLDGITVTYQGNTLIKDLDYTVEYSDNVSVGTCNYTVRPLAPNFDADDITTFTGNFTILSEPKVFTLDPIPEETYWYATPRYPQLTFKDSAGNPLALVEGRDYKYCLLLSANEVPRENEQLWGKSYTNPYDSLTVRVFGMGPYAGIDCQQPFKINRLEFEDTDSDLYHVEIDELFYRDNRQLNFKGGIYYGDVQLRQTDSASTGGAVFTKAAYNELAPNPLFMDDTLNAGDTLDKVYLGSFPTRAASFLHLEDLFEIELDDPVVVQPRLITDIPPVISEFIYSGKSLAGISVFNDAMNGTDLDVSSFLKILPRSQYDTVWHDDINVGRGYVVITGKNNFTGSAMVRFEIKPYNISPKDAVEVAEIAPQPFTGTPVEPDLLITDTNGNTLVEGIDYDVNYGFNDRPGTGYAYVTAKGNYTGSLTVPFPIALDLETGINANTVTITGHTSPIIAGGAEVGDIKPAVVLSVGTESGTYTLQEGVDYELEVILEDAGGDPSPQSVGDLIGKKATVTITGTGGFSGTLKYVLEVSLAAEAVTDPDPAITFGQATLPSSAFSLTGTDGPLDAPAYTVTPKDRWLDVGTSGLALVEVTAEGANQGARGYIPYTPTAKAPVTLSATTVLSEGASATAVTPQTVSFTYNGASQTLPGLALAATNLDSRGLSLGQDQDATVSYTNNQNAGTAQVQVTIPETSKNYQSQTASFAFTITPYSLQAGSAVNAAPIAPQPFTDRPAEPRPYLYDTRRSNAALIQGQDYTLAYATNTAPGTAAVIVYGTGNYTGEWWLPFDITDGRQDISAANFTVLDGPQATVGFAAGLQLRWTGAPLTPPVGLGSPQGQVLQAGSDYTVTYANNTAPGLASITLTGTGAYKGSRQVFFTIKRGVALAGEDRYHTSALTALEAFPSGAPGVIIATGEKYPDALAAAGLAGTKGYPIVMVRSDSVPATAEDALRRLRPREILIMGSESTVSAAAAAQVGAITGCSAAAGTIRRYGGKDRYHTAALIYQAGVGSWSDTAIIATGANFPDALAISPYAYFSKSPLFMVSDTISSEVADALATGGFRRVVITGSAASVSDAVAAEAARLTGTSFAAGTMIRFAGQTRFETARMVASWSLGQGMTLDGAGIATGTNFPDALGAGPLLGSRGSVALLVSDDNRAPLDLLQARAPVHTLHVFGQTNSVSDASRQEALRRLDWPREAL